jgi:hypothetical protein
VHSALLGVIICLDFDPYFFFFSCFLAGCFSFIIIFLFCLFCPILFAHKWGCREPILVGL